MRERDAGLCVFHSASAPTHFRSAAMRRGASFETDAPRVPEPVAAVESDDDESTIPPPLDPSRERRLPIRTILMALFLFTTGSVSRSGRRRRARPTPAIPAHLLPASAR